MQRGAGRSSITTSATTGGDEARTPRHSGSRLLLLIANGRAASTARSASSARSNRKAYDAACGQRSCMPSGCLAEQAIDDTGRCTGQAERECHAHQRFVAIEFGWWRVQRILVGADVSAHKRGKARRRRSVPDLGEFQPFLCRFGSRDTQIPMLSRV